MKNNLLSSKTLIAALSMCLIAPVSAEHYIALDAALIDGSIRFGDGTTRLDLNTARLRFGKRYQEYGWEIQVLGSADDIGPFSGGPGLANGYDITGGIGIQLTASDKNRNFYGGIGLMQLSAEVSAIVSGSVVAASKRNSPFFTFTAGAQYEFSKGLRASIDYTFYHGNIDCNFCSPAPLQPGQTSSEPDVRLSTFNIGLNYSF